MELHATRLASISCAIKSPSEEGLDRNFMEVAGLEQVPEVAYFQ
jgi:hypothetical protein